MVDTTSTFKQDTVPAEPPATLHILSANPGKRRTEIIYLIWFLCTVPIQGAVVFNLSYDHANDVLLIGQSLVMGVGTLVLPVIFRHPSDRGLPITELYGFRFGIFLTIFAMLGGFIGTDPWYEVLHGHFAFNTEVNPNGVPLFMLFMTISVFAFYSVILGSLYRVITGLLSRTNTTLSADSIWRQCRAVHHPRATDAAGGNVRLRRSAAAELLLRQRRRHVGAERPHLRKLASRVVVVLYPLGHRTRRADAAADDRRIRLRHHRRADGPDGEYQSLCRTAFRRGQSRRPHAQRLKPRQLPRC